MLRVFTNKKVLCFCIVGLKSQQWHDEFPSLPMLRVFTNIKVPRLGIVGQKIEDGAIATHNNGEWHDMKSTPFQPTRYTQSSLIGYQHLVFKVITFKKHRPALNRIYFLLATLRMNEKLSSICLQPIGIQVTDH
jgi:hypothetical protein